MAKWQRSFFQPVLPLGEDGRRVTGSKEHIALSRMAAGEGMVLLKNEKNTLPIRKGTKVAFFGKGTVDYVKGGGGSGDVTVEYIRNLYEGMKIKEDEGKVEVFDKLAKYYEENIRKQYAEGAFRKTFCRKQEHTQILRSLRSAVSQGKAGIENVKLHRMDMSWMVMRRNRQTYLRRFSRMAISALQTQRMPWWRT